MTLTDLLHFILQRMDLNSDDALFVSADETVGWPADGAELLVKWGMLSRTKPRNKLLCDGCEEQCIMPVEVVQKPKQGAERAFIACDKRDDIDIVPVDSRRLLQWRIDFNRWVILMAQMLETDQAPQAHIQNRLWGLGKILVAGNRQEMFFGRGTNWSNGQKIFDWLADRSPAGDGVLLTPDGYNRIEKGGIACNLSLRDVLIIKEAQIAFDISLIERICQSATSIPTILGHSSDEKAVGNVFRRDGEYWTLSFDGKTVYIQNRDGMAYIAYLLQRPGKEFPTNDLYFAIKGTPPVHISKYDSYGLEAAGFEREYRKTLHLPIDLADEQALKDVKENLNSLREELDEAKSNNDFERERQIIEKISYFEDYLTDSQSPRGKSRKFRDEMEKTRKNVSMAISRVFGDIREQHESLARHLMNSIHTGYRTAYTPDSPIHWQV